MCKGIQSRTHLCNRLTARKSLTEFKCKLAVGRLNVINVKKTSVEV